MNSIDGRIILDGLYDINYGIHDHTKSKNPLSKVSAHPTEDILSGSRFERSLKRFISCDVLAQTGITFDKAIQMPVYKFKQLCEISLEMAKAKSQAASDAISEAANSSGLPDPTKRKK